MAVFLEDDQDIGEFLEQELQQELQRQFNSEESAVPATVQGTPGPADALDEPPVWFGQYS
jgi:hypothetical protein